MHTGNLKAILIIAKFGQADIYRNEPIVNRTRAVCRIQATIIRKHSFMTTTYATHTANIPELRFVVNPCQFT